jgi:hypothetical protein
MANTPASENEPTPTSIESTNLQSPLFTVRAFVQAVQSNPEAWHQHIQALDRSVDELMSTKDRLMTEGVQVTAARDQAIEEITKLRERIDGLQVSLAESHKKLIAKMEENSQKDTIGHTSSKSTKHPDPPVYGGDRSELQKFLTQLRTKLFINRDHWFNDKDRLRYCLSRVESTALDTVLPHFKDDDTITLKDPKAFMDLLEQAFGDPDKQQTAQRELEKLQMKKDPFSTYMATFRRFMADTGYDSVALKAKLLNGLSQELKQLMLHQDVPAAFEDLVALLQKLDNRLHAFAATTQSLKPFSYQASNAGPRRNQGYPNQAPSSASTASSVNITRTNSPASSVTSIVPSDSASNIETTTPMELDGVRRGPLSDEERLRRKTQGLCGYCGLPGHQSHTCRKFKCFNCGEVGHGISSCTKPRRLRIQELKAENTTPEVTEKSLS